jgi:hypothetical protein
MKKDLKPLEESNKKSQEFTLILSILSQRTQNPDVEDVVVEEEEDVEVEEGVAVEEAEEEEEDLVVVVEEVVVVVVVAVVEAVVVVVDLGVVAVMEEILNLK